MAGTLVASDFVLRREGAKLRPQGAPCGRRVGTEREGACPPPAFGWWQAAITRFATGPAGASVDEAPWTGRTET